MNTKYQVKVAVSGLSFWVDKEFTYLVDDKIKNSVFPGAKVVVPFGRGGKKREGIVTGLCEHDSSIPLKSVQKVQNEETFVTKEDIELAKYMAKRYYSTLYDCLSLMSIPGFGVKIKDIYILGEASFSYTDEEKEICEFIKEKGYAYFDELKEKFPQKEVQAVILSMLKEKKLIKEEKISEHSGKILKVAYLTNDNEKICDFINQYGKKARAQVRLIEALTESVGMPVSELVAVSGTSRASVKALIEKGIIEIRNEAVKEELFSEEKMFSHKKPILNDEQINAVNTVMEKRKEGIYNEFVIKGVTGSGKTEIYLELCENIIKEEKQAIILVPEISLTPQIRARFFGRFGDNVAVLHSALSISERRSEWRRIKSGEVSIVVGARSAVFAPFSKLSMIIVDEEHETSYKSEMSPRYDAREVARKRMESVFGTLILASATPSITSYYRTESGAATLITLNNRYNNTPLPEVLIVDLKNEIKGGNYGVISEKLQYLLEKNKEKGEKSILLLNRRGYSTFISCRDCGYVVKCPKCEVAMTYHSVDNRLKCHYCQTEFNTPALCPECGSTSIRYFGSGTQKLEEELYKIFPEAKVIRMDNDTTTAKMAHERLLKRFEKEAGSILIGTQMIAKGLDFKDVSVASVIAADSTLFVGGYLGNEKTFSLITQLCGRAGRGDKQGIAVVQTYQPEHYAIQAAKTQDYDAFYKNEIVFRKNIKYPPFCEIINIVFTGDNDKNILEFSDSIKPLLTEAVKKYNERQNYISMYGPMPCAIMKIKDKYRYHITIKCKSADSIRNSLGYALSELMLKAKHNISVYVDVNPVSFI